MPANSRLLDMYAGISPPHGYTPMAGIIMVLCAGDHTVESYSQATVTSIGIDFCKIHVTFIVAGSGTSKTNGLAKARVGDPVVGGTIGIMVTGAGTEVTG